MTIPPLVPRALDRFARMVLTRTNGIGEQDDLIQALREMGDLDEHAPHFEAIAAEAVRIREAGEWEVPGELTAKRAPERATRVKRPRPPRPEGEGTPIARAEAIQIAAAYLSVHPESRPEETFAHLEETGRPISFSLSTWKHVYSKEARRTAGVGPDRRKVSPKQEPDAKKARKAPATKSANGKKLSREEMIELAVGFYLLNPEATSREAYVHLLTHGTPAIGERSWVYNPDNNEAAWRRAKGLPPKGHAPAEEVVSEPIAEPVADSSSSIEEMVIEVPDDQRRPQILTPENSPLLRILSWDLPNSRRITLTIPCDLTPRERAFVVALIGDFFAIEGMERIP